jgi:hypothetical protein
MRAVIHPAYCRDVTNVGPFGLPTKAWAIFIGSAVGWAIVWMLHL